MMRQTIAASLSFLLISVTSFTTYAGFEEGRTAAKKGDFVTALREWNPLAAQGNAEAQYNLGLMYATGLGVPPDYKEAVKLYRLAAGNGSASAQNNLSDMYADGQGVPKTSKRPSNGTGWRLKKAMLTHRTTWA